MKAESETTYSLSQPLIGSIGVAEGNKKQILVPPSAELVDAGVEYLQKIGFRPDKSIRGKNWVISEPMIREFPTIYDNIYVQVIRDEAGEAKSVNLIGHK